MKQNTQNKILSGFVLLVMLCSLMAMAVFATETTDPVDAPVTNGIPMPEAVLNLESGVPVSGDGYTWNGETLTIAENLDLTSTEENQEGIIFPAGATLLLNANLNVTTVDTGIVAKGALTISGTGNLNVEVTGDSASGVICTSDTLSITTTGDLNVSSTGYEAIYTDERMLSITGCNDVTLTSEESYAVYAGGLALDIQGTFNVKSEDRTACYLTNQSIASSIKTGGNLVVTSPDCGISSYGALTLNVGGTTTFDIEYASLWMEVSDLTLAGAGQLDVDSMMINGSLAINDTVTLNINYVECDSCTIASGATVNGLVCVKEDDLDYHDTIYGNLIANGDTFAFGKLSFAEGSTLTIPTLLDVDWMDYTIDFTNANIINNGTIMLPEGTDPKVIQFEGSGMVVIANSDGEPLVYNNQGELQTVVQESIRLTDEGAVSNEYYCWEETADGAWMLTVAKNVLIRDIMIQVDGKEVVLNLENDMQLDFLLVDTMDGSVTVEGNGMLTVENQLLVFAETLVFEQGTTSQLPTIQMLTRDELDGETTIIVNGTVYGSTLFATNLTINNGAYLELDSSSDMGVPIATMDLPDSATMDMMQKIPAPYLMPALVLSRLDQEPDFVLGDRVRLMTQGSYQVGTDEEPDGTLSYIGTVTTDGTLPNPSDTSNVASKVIYATIPSYTVTVSTTGNGAVTPDGTVELLEGSEQTFTFVPAGDYKVGDVLLDGESVGAVDSYTLTDIRDNHTLKVIFTQISVGGDDGDDEDKTPGTATGDSTALPVVVLVVAGCGLALLLKKKTFFVR